MPHPYALGGPIEFSLRLSQRCKTHVSFVSFCKQNRNTSFSPFGSDVYPEQGFSPWLIDFRTLLSLTDQISWSISTFSGSSDMVLRKKYSLPFFNYSFYYFVWVMICAYTVLIILLQLRDIIGLLFLLSITIWMLVMAILPFLFLKPFSSILTSPTFSEIPHTFWISMFSHRESCYQALCVCWWHGSACPPSGNDTCRRLL